MSYEIYFAEFCFCFGKGLIMTNYNREPKRPDRHDSINDFQSQIIAAQDMRDEAVGYGIELIINADGTLTMFHGTSRENAESIRANGFEPQTYFSHNREGAEYYSNVKCTDGEILEVWIDARNLEFAAGGAEFYSPYRLINYNGVWKAGNNPEKCGASESKEKKCL